MDFEVQFFFMYMALTDGASVVPHRGQQKRQSGPCRDPFACIGFVQFVNSICDLRFFEAGKISDLFC